MQIPNDNPSDDFAFRINQIVKLNDLIGTLICAYWQMCLMNIEFAYIFWITERLFRLNREDLNIAMTRSLKTNIPHRQIIWYVWKLIRLSQTACSRVSTKYGYHVRRTHEFWAGLAALSDLTRFYVLICMNQTRCQEYI